MPCRHSVRATARVFVIAALLCAFLASLVIVSASAGARQPSAPHASKKAKKCTRYKSVRVKRGGHYKRVRRCVSHRKCTRYKTVRVKRGGHYKRIRRCVSRKKCTRYKTVRVKRGGHYKRVRRCVSRKKCTRYKIVRVKRGGHYKRIRRCVKTKSPAAAPPPGSGTNTGPLNGGLLFGLNSVNPDDATLSNVAGAGVSMARVPLHWADVEKSPGQFSWSGYDSVFGSEARHGITPLPVLLDDPSWAESNDFTIPSGSAAAYADFTAHATARYGPGGTFWAQNRSIPYHPITYWEIWNEPYWYLFNDAHSDPATYARLVRAAAAAGKAANPQARFLLEADLTSYVSASQQVEWVDALYNAVPDLNSWFDGVAVHPYSWPKSPDVYSGGRWDFKRIGDIRAKFVAHGAANKGFWITEVGYPTCPGSTRCVSESAQASDLARIFQLVKSDYASFMQAIFIYNYKDPSSQNSADPEDWFGLLRRDGSPKPAWNELRQATGAG
jgi:polysaccharide biosynthesis protein PslG